MNMVSLEEHLRLALRQHELLTLRTTTMEAAIKLAMSELREAPSRATALAVANLLEQSLNQDMGARVKLRKRA